MSYRNKTFVSFASEHISSYRLMCAWRANERIDFDFYDAHDLNTARDTSTPDTIKRRLRERLNNAKQVVMLIGDVTRAKAARPAAFLHYEVGAITQLNLPIVFANLNGSRLIEEYRLPASLLQRYTISVSFQPKIIKFALDGYVAAFRSSREKLTKGPHYYKLEIYAREGL